MAFMITFSMQAQIPDTLKNNPLLMNWDTPYETPPFDLIKDEHYLPAFNYALKVAKEEIRRIEQTKQFPTFRNTIEALDASGSLLNKISGIFFNMNYCNTTPELQKLAREISPMLTEYSNDIYLSAPLFSRVKRVYENPGELTTEQAMLLDKTYKAFINSGANLSPQDKETFREISVELSKLSLLFSENVLASTNDYVKNVLDEKELSGIPQQSLEIAKEKAKSKGLEGWVFDLSYPSYSAVMTYADNRELRKELYLRYNQRAYNDQFDNQETIKSILKYRTQLAQLLGFETYAAYALQDRMAENEQNVYQLEEELLKFSYPVMKKEMEELTQFAQSLGFTEPLQRWDLSYFSEKQKTQLFEVNDEMLKPYFKLENVIDGVFTLASGLFDLTFKPNTDIQVYHPDVKVYEVFRKGEFMAVLYLDFYPRDSKKGGAWMTSFREQRKNGETDVRPLVSLVMNFTPSTADNPSLLTFDEVRTFLHEFGHATHGMLSEVHYESLSGTSVPRDFVELPSQLLENWAVEKEFLDKFAYHYITKEVIPDELIQKIKNSDNYLAGYASCRQLTFGLLDMMWHTTNPNTIEDVVSMERKAIARTEFLPTVEGTCTSTAFSHIFSGGYAAGYYGYKWAEVLDADAFSLFKENGIFDKKTADAYVENILSKGGSEKPMTLFVQFRGREPKINALLERSGLK